MTTPTDLLAELMKLVRARLYAGPRDAFWFPQQKMVQQALTHPARKLKELGVTMPSARYREIMVGIVETIVTRGDPGGAQWISRYFLTCVQNHWEHNGDRYYAQCKGTLRDVLGHVERRQSRAAQSPDPTVEILAGVHYALLVGKRKPKGKASAEPMQGDLFGAAKGQLVAKQRAKTVDSAHDLRKSPEASDSREIRT